MAFLAFAITLIDWPRVISPPFLHTTCIGLAILFAAIFFFRAGHRLSRTFSQPKDSA